MLLKKNIQPGSPEARTLKFAGFRGMLASYAMGVVLVIEKTNALVAIAIAGAVITGYQLYVANGGIKKQDVRMLIDKIIAGAEKIRPRSGIERAIEQARQRGIADALDDLHSAGRLYKFNVDYKRIQRLVTHLYHLAPDIFEHDAGHGDERIEEPNLILEEAYERAYNQKDEILERIEEYSHFGIFMFIHNYHVNWVANETGRGPEVVQQAMIDILFPLTPHDEIWAQYRAFKPVRKADDIWQFSRQRYLWAKDQWPNLSDRITTIWTLQDFGLVPQDVDFDMVITVANGKQFRRVKVHTNLPEVTPQGASVVEESIATPLLEPNEVEETLSPPEEGHASGEAAESPEEPSLESPPSEDDDGIIADDV